MFSHTGYSKIGREVYKEDILSLAEFFIGKVLVRKFNNVFLAGKIVELEAYDGSCDKAAHTYNGITKRNEVMFNEGGYLYVYFTYGVHYCCNIVTGYKNEGNALLIRAVEPLNNFNILAQNRFGKENLTPKEQLNLTSGPAKLCKAFGIDKNDNGKDLCGNEIYLLNTPTEKSVRSTRIGISKSTELMWRFYVQDNRYVSKR